MLQHINTVSYTHLTLPTNREVEISEDAATLKKKKRQEESEGERQGDKTRTKEGNIKRSKT